MCPSVADCSGLWTAAQVADADPRKLKIHVFIYIYVLVQEYTYM